MINKLHLQSIIDKYYLKVNESVKWKVVDNTLEINFMSPTKDVIGRVKVNNFELEDCELSIFDTKKLQNIISICSNDLLLEIEKTHNIFTKLKISDLNFNLTYALADPLLIGRVGEVTIPEWEAVLNLSTEDLFNLVKTKSALGEVDNMIITTIKSLDDENICQFIFGDEEGHNNKITYQILGDIQNTNIKLPFNSELFKTILHSNKDMETGKLYLNSKGLMKLEFKFGDIETDYYIVRKSDNNF